MGCFTARYQKACAYQQGCQAPGAPMVTPAGSVSLHTLFNQADPDSIDVME